VRGGAGGQESDQLPLGQRPSHHQDPKTPADPHDPAPLPPPPHSDAIVVLGGPPCQTYSAGLPDNLRFPRRYAAAAAERAWLNAVATAAAARRAAGAAAAAAEAARLKGRADARRTALESVAGAAAARRQPSRGERAPDLEAPAGGEPPGAERPQPRPAAAAAQQDECAPAAPLPSDAEVEALKRAADAASEAAATLHRDALDAHKAAVAEAKADAAALGRADGLVKAFIALYKVGGLHGRAWWGFQGLRLPRHRSESVAGPVIGAGRRRAARPTRL
jgi:hypothetical protein